MFGNPESWMIFICLGTLSLGKGCGSIFGNVEILEKSQISTFCPMHLVTVK
jgi:hypothetical protein